MVDIRVLVVVKTILGEGPLWDVDEQRLYWIDSFGMNVFRCTPDGSEIRAWDVPEKIATRMLFGAMDQVATSWVLGKRKYRLTDAAEAVATIFLRGVATDAV